MRLEIEGRELLRRLLQDHLDLRAQKEARHEAMADADEVARTRVEPKHARGLTTIFGQVTVERLAYRASGVPNLYPADAVLNLPLEKHSHGLRRQAAIEAARGSFDEAADAITRATGVRVGKRQVEELAAAAAVDVAGFYAAAKPEPSPDTDPLVLSAKATRSHLRYDERKGADAWANYLSNKRAHVDYAHALRQGWPIATCVIEGACRHLVKNRMDITGALEIGRCRGRSPTPRSHLQR